MKRRYFLCVSGVSAMAVMIPVVGLRPTVEIGKLQMSLKSLADPVFREFASTKRPELLLGSLVEKGVVGPNGDIDTSIIRASARKGLAIEYNGAYYNPLELELYGLACLLCEEVC